MHEEEVTWQNLRFPESASKNVEYLFQDFLDGLRFSKNTVNEFSTYFCTLLSISECANKVIKNKYMLYRLCNCFLLFLLVNM